MMKKIVYIYAIIILGLLLFVPRFLSADTYYDWEQVQVDILPEPTKDIMNKVYIKDDKYYVVKEVLGEVTPLQIGDSMNGRTFYNAIPDNLMEQDVWKNLSNCSDYYYCGGSIISSSGNPFGFSINYTKGEFILSYKQSGSFAYVYKNNNNVIELNRFNTVFDYDLVFTERYSVNMFSGHPELYEFIDYIFDHISTTPLENTYEWLEVDKYQVKEIKLDDRDFYLFYNFEDIKKFNILSNYDLESFTDFQKVVIVLGFNILFLGIIGLTIYIFIKLVYKGISMMFKF